MDEWKELLAVALIQRGRVGGGEMEHLKKKGGKEEEEGEEERGLVIDSVYVSVLY